MQHIQMPHGVRPTLFQKQVDVMNATMMNQRTMVAKWVFIYVCGHCQSIHLSTLHVCNLRVSGHHILSYPLKSGVAVPIWRSPWGKHSKKTLHTIVH